MRIQLQETKLALQTQRREYEAKIADLEDAIEKEKLNTEKLQYSLTRREQQFEKIRNEMNNQIQELKRKLEIVNNDRQHKEIYKEKMEQMRKDYESKIEQMRKDYQSLEQIYKETHDQLQKTTLELKLLTSRHEEYNESYERELRDWKKRYQEMSEALEGAKKDYESVKMKGKIYDELKERYDKMESEYLSHLDSLKRLEVECHNQKQELEELRRTKLELGQQVELLMKDKVLALK